MRLLSTLTISLLISLMALSSCTSKKGAGLDPNADGKVAPFSDEELALEEGRWNDGNIPEPGQSIPGLNRDILFGYDSSVIPGEYHQDLQDFAKTLNENADLIVEIEGHCDKRGTSEYNMALGEERAKSVANLLTSFGASKNQITWVSYGEEIPVDPAETEDAYAKNRRAHLALYRKGTEG